MPAQELKAIEDMDHEELVAALPKLREEATKADARAQAAVHRLAQTADEVDVPTYVEVHEDHLVVDVRGREKLLSMLSRLYIPQSMYRAQRQTQRSSTHCGGGGGYRASIWRGSDSTTCMAAETRPS